MKSLQFVSYGKPSEDTLKFKEIPSLTATDLGATDVLIKVKAVSINPIDWKIVSGALKPLLSTESGTTVGYDVSGVLEAVGKDVTNFKAGDEIFTRLPRWGAFQELAKVDVHYIAAKPKNLTFEEAAAVPLAGLTAYQAIFDHGKVTKDTVKTALVPAALGGVGFFANQILENVVGIENVYSTVSTAKIVKAQEELPGVKLIDYKKADFGQELKDKVDYIFDTTGELAKEAAAIKPNGTVISIASTPSAKVTEHFLAAGGHRLGFIISKVLDAKFFWDSRHFKGKNVRYEYFFLNPKGAHLEILAKWIEEGKLKVLLDKVYDWDQAVDAFKAQATGSSTGKVVVRVA